MGASASQPQRPRPFIPGEFTVAWLTFKGDSVEDTAHRHVARKDGLLSSKLFRGLFSESTMAVFAAHGGEFIPREMFICTLALSYEGNTEDRISFIFTMYSIIYGMERESEGCIHNKDYTYLLEYLEGFNFIPKKFYAAFDECQIPADGLLLNSQFVQWVRRYPVLMDFLASHLPPSVGPLMSPPSIRTGDALTAGDVLNNSPSCRLDKDKTVGGAHFGSFDFIGGEDSGDESDEAYDSDQISEMDDFGTFQDTQMARDACDASEFSDGDDGVPHTPTTGESLTPTGDGSARRQGRGSRSRGVQKMGRNITKTLGGGISKVGNVGRSILHGGKPSYADQAHHGHHSHAHSQASQQLDSTSASLLAAGYAFSSESQISKKYVCGYLHKISDGKWSKRSWHRRWFVLDRQQGVLSYYRYNPANLLSATSRGTIVHMNDENDDPQDDVPHAFSIQERELSSGIVDTGVSTTPRDVVGTMYTPKSTVSTAPSSAPSTGGYSSNSPQNMLYLNKSHPWYRGELNLNLDNVSLLFEKSMAKSAPTRYFFQVSTLALEEIDSKRGIQYKLCAETEDEFDRWTHAIADAINRKLVEKAPPRSAPVLTHQQVYRQRLQQEQAAKEDPKEATLPSDQPPFKSAASPSQELVPSPSLPPASKAKSTSQTTARSANVASASPVLKAEPSPSKHVPPRIITYSSSPKHTTQPAEWRLSIQIEGSKQCLIVGFMVNIVALKCVAAEQAILKVLVCIVATCAYVMSVYNPTPRRRDSAPSMSMGGIPGQVHLNGGNMVDTGLLSTEVTACADPGTCCLHRPHGRRDTMDGIGVSDQFSSGGVAGGVVPGPMIMTPPLGGFKKFQLGFSMAKTEMNTAGKAGNIPQAWTTTRAETFVIRGHDYKKTKRKEPSKPALFEFLGADLLRTDCKVDLVCQRFQVPEENVNDKLFIINAQLPSYGPSVWGDAACDGPGYSLILCWKIPESVREELKDPKSKEIRLLKRFLEAGNDTTLTDRFKVIAQVVNQDDCGLTGMAKKLLVSHNATPVLTRPQHRIYHFDDGSTEVDVDIHAFSYIARRGIHMLLDKTAKLVIDISFVLQGETEDELPERILGCCRLDSVDVNKAKDLPLV